MSLGIPWSLNTCRTKTSAVSLAEGSLGKAMKCIILENLSTTVRMTILPAELGSPVTKSMEMRDRGRNKPAERRLELLAWAQTGHAGTKSLTSLDQEGHQSHWLTIKGFGALLDDMPAEVSDRIRGPLISVQVECKDNGQDRQKDQECWLGH